jgi:hypothetical protein
MSSRRETYVLDYAVRRGERDTPAPQFRGLINLTGMNVARGHAGGPLKSAIHQYGGLRALWRSKDAQYSQTTKLRVPWFVDGLLGGRERGVYVGISLDPRRFAFPDRRPVDPSLYEGAIPSQLVKPLAALRTDQDRFFPEEADLLSYHAYWSIHARVASLYTDLAVTTPSWREFAGMKSDDIMRLQGLLDRGAMRLPWASAESMERYGCRPPHPRRN